MLSPCVSSSRSREAHDCHCVSAWYGVQPEVAEARVTMRRLYYADREWGMNTADVAIFAEVCIPQTSVYQ